MESDITYRTLRITEITIRNFRPIRNLTLPVDGCTIISGLNDVGKSNILFDNFRELVCKIEAALSK